MAITLPGASGEAEAATTSGDSVRCRMAFTVVRRWRRPASAQRRQRCEPLGHHLGDRRYPVIRQAVPGGKLQYRQVGRKKCKPLDQARHALIIPRDVQVQGRRLSFARSARTKDRARAEDGPVSFFRPRGPRVPVDVRRAWRARRAASRQCGSACVLRGRARKIHSARAGRRGLPVFKLGQFDFAHHGNVGAGKTSEHEVQFPGSPVHGAPQYLPAAHIEIVVLGVHRPEAALFRRQTLACNGCSRSPGFSGTWAKTCDPQFSILSLPKHRPSKASGRRYRKV